MANLKNWLPNMDPAERMWFDACPKAVLYAIAQQFAMRVGDDFTAEGAFEVMQAEWSALHSNGIVPQKPFDVAKAQAKVASYLAQREQFRRDNPAGVRLGDSFAKSNILSGEMLSVEKSAQRQRETGRQRGEIRPLPPATSNGGDDARNTPHDSPVLRAAMRPRPLCHPAGKGARRITRLIDKL